MSYHCQVEAARIRSWLLDMQAGYPSKAASTATIAGRGPVALQLRRVSLRRPLASCGSMFICLREPKQPTGVQ